MFGFGKKEELGPLCATANGRAAYEGLGGGDWSHLTYKNFSLSRDENEFDTYWDWFQHFWDNYIPKEVLNKREWKVSFPKIIYYHFVEFWLLGGGIQPSRFADSDTSEWHQKDINDSILTEYAAWIELDPVTKLRDVWQTDDDHCLRNRFFDFAAYLENIRHSSDLMGVSHLKNPLNFHLPVFVKDAKSLKVKKNMDSVEVRSNLEEVPTRQKPDDRFIDNDENFDGLESAKKMFEQGLIDEMEYKALKKKILDI